ncbi:hypothetical protein EG68_10951 [Paragonimus skrjabini miyazakii]|uniref:C2H2-type domain-containing protein n=1 Tax=Paragonimus skrjabini miyazakii TaxID=59628 RepID=A0A8S9YR91_9TREM|nr:hypothetical protein EG68_10951 [Paragonimus skrjabini miyazakii]
MVKTVGNSSVTVSDGDAAFEHSSSVVSDFNTSDSLLHLLTSQQNVDEKVEAAVHPMADLEMLTGAHRGPAVPLSLLKENSRVCITCGVDFKSRASLHAHLMRHRHKLGTLEQFTRLPKYECRSCEGGINCSSMLKHKCFSKQQADIKSRVKVLDRDGSPLVCILCRGRLLPSRVHLIIHIIVAHSIHRDPYKCVFCQAEFHSENLMMQEVHAFDCHAPELFMLTRKACFKMIRNAKGGVTDATVPFTCFYDSTKLESADLSAIFKPKQNRMQQMDSDGSPGADRTNVTVPKRRICTATFSTLDEYTTHLCCYHGAVAPERFIAPEEEDPIEEVRRAKSQTNRVPGPTVRELLKSQAAGHHAPNKNNDEFGPPAPKSTKSHTTLSLLLRKTRKMDRSGPMLRSRQRVATSTYNPVINRTSKQQEMCRICLEHFQDEQRLNAHITAFHAPESRKRLKHLADKEKLSGILDIDLLCTECYIMFPDTLSLQVHMMVSHASKDWRHCGLCNYEFYSENGGTPNHLRLVKFSSNQDSLAAASRIPGNPLLSDGGSSIDAWPLPAELMWRMIMTHETRHRERLFQPRPVLYLPLILIDQLINGNAIQAVMAANWLVRKAQEEIEGVHATDEQLSNVPDLITTEEAFADVPNRTKLIGVDGIMIEEAKASLITVLRQNEECHEEDAEKSRQAKPTSLRLSTASAVPGTHLPAWLVHRFTELGELNAARQVELDFVENL